METKLRNKISKDAAADNSWAESLSFAGLVCIQDQQSQSLNISANRINKQDPEFEFGRTRPDLNATDPIKYFPADLLISDDKIQPEAFLLQSKRSHLITQSSQDFLLAQDSLPATHSSSRRSSANTSGMKVSENPNHMVNNQENRHTAERLSFGRKLFQTFLSPWRQCHAITPTAKTHTVPSQI
ncbi:hypothetical protein CFP56_020598 [Quercus suber]|uniref:Uncharacterized protein n=1 Tax=Quercus suber TaxID=58331 RepID=A0AAW0KF40_QUESU